MNEKKTSLKPYARLKAKVREYEDKETGKMKGVYVEIGTLFSSPHGSHMAVKIDTIPVADWNGWVSVFKIEGFEEASEDKEDEDNNKVDF